MADPTISGDGADPDQDGLPNYLEYALGTDPKVNEPALAFHLQIETIAGQPAATLTYTLNTNATDAVVTLLESLDLFSWTPATTSLLSQTNDGLRNTLKLQIHPGEPPAGKLFLRLAASPAQ